MSVFLSPGREARRSSAAWFGGGGAAGSGGANLSGEPTRKRGAPDEGEERSDEGEWRGVDDLLPTSPDTSGYRSVDDLLPSSPDITGYRSVDDLLPSSPDITGYTTPVVLPSTSPDRTGYTTPDVLPSTSPDRTGYGSVDDLAGFVATPPRAVSTVATPPRRNDFVATPPRPKGIATPPRPNHCASVGDLPAAGGSSEDNWKCCIGKDGALTYVNDTAQERIRFPDEKQKVWELGLFQRNFLIKCDGWQPLCVYAPDFHGLTLAVLRILINNKRYRPDEYVFLDRHGAALKTQKEAWLSVSDVYIAGVDTEGLGSEANPIRVSITATKRAKGSRGPSEEVEEGECMLCCEPYHADSHRSQVVCSADDGCRTFAMCRLCVLRSSILLQHPVEIDDEVGYETVNYDATVCPQCRKKDAFQEDRLPALPQLVQAKVEAETYDLDLGEDVVPEGHQYLKGSRVSKEFDGIAFGGWVVGGGWEGMRRTYKVLYSDGDGEVVYEEELAVIVA